jgi:hypothetical protein
MEFPAKLLIPSRASFGSFQSNLRDCMLDATLEFV